MAINTGNEIAKTVLERFCHMIEEIGTIGGFSYSFSPRKLELTDNIFQVTIMVRADAVFTFREYDKHTLLRFKTEEEYFQASCTDVEVCDAELEKLIHRAVYLYTSHLSDSLNIGGWELNEIS